VLSVISGATQLLAVNLGDGTAPKPSHAAVQRWTLAVGAAGLAATRELNAPAPPSSRPGALVVAALVALGVLLIQIRVTATLSRFDRAIDGYLFALCCGVAGALLASGATLHNYAHVRPL
jgi:hypothetical protein